MGKNTKHKPMKGPKAPVNHKKQKKPSKAASKGSGLKSIMKTIGSTVGSLYGPVGSRIGSEAAGALAHIMGQGDYEISNNTLLSNNGPPSFSTNGDDVIIKHRELLSDLTSSTTFSSQGYLINAGNATMFPWLSGIALNFEEYEFFGLVIEYKTTSGSAISGTNNALGTVMIATDYNCSNNNFSTKRAMETTEFSTSAAANQSFIHPIECNRSRNILGKQYVSSATSIGGVTGDPHFYFLANTQIATTGMLANSVTIGEVWVSYQVRLSRPTFQSLSLNITDYNRPYYHICYNIDTNGKILTQTLINGLDPIVPDGDFPYVRFTSTGYNNDTNDYYYPQPGGLYYCWYTYSFNSTTGDATSYIMPNTSVNSESINYFGNSTTSLVANIIAPIGVTQQDVTFTPPFVNTNNYHLNQSQKFNGTFSYLWKPHLATAANYIDVVLPQLTYTSFAGSGTNFVTLDVHFAYISPINQTIDKDLWGKKKRRDEPSPLSHDLMSNNLKVKDDYIIVKQ